MGIKSRIVSVLLWDEHGAVKGRGFNPGRRIGSIRDRIRVCERREIDELIILDISATPNKRSPRFDEVQLLCENLFMPVTVGGGIRNLNDIRRLLASGADKVSINSAANSRLISDAAMKFGSQAIVISIDANSSGLVKTHCGSKDAGFTAIEWALDAELNGAGEILLTDIERDGTMKGYNLDLIRSVSEAVSIPVIACGGCSSYEDMERAFDAGAHAVAVGALFQFTDNTPREASRYLNNRGIAARDDSGKEVEIDPYETAVIEDYDRSGLDAETWFESRGRFMLS